MKKLSFVVSAVILTVSLILSGCGRTEYVTFTATETLTRTHEYTTTVTSYVSTTSPVTTMSPPYSSTVKEAIVIYAASLLEDRGLINLVARLGGGWDYISVVFYGESNSEVIDIVQTIIDEIAPGLALRIEENFTTK